MSSVKFKTELQKRVLKLASAGIIWEKYNALVLALQCHFLAGKVNNK